MEITVDTKPLTSFLNDFEQRQAPFALSRALNDVGDRFQKNQREHMHSIWTVRRKEWVDRSVKRVSPPARKDRLEVTYAIETPGDRSRSDILAKFETETIKRPTSGKTTAIPIEAKRIERSTNRLGALGPFTGGKGRLIGFGKKRTFMVDLGNGAKGVFQRVGNRKGKARGIHGPLIKTRDRNVRLLYLLKPSTPLTPNLEFMDHAKEAATHFAEFFKARFAEAMRTARR